MGRPRKNFTWETAPPIMRMLSDDLKREKLRKIALTFKSQDKTKNFMGEIFVGLNGDTLEDVDRLLEAI